MKTQAANNNDVNKTKDKIENTNNIHLATLIDKYKIQHERIAGMIDKTDVYTFWPPMPESKKTPCEENIELYKNLTVSFQNMATLANETDADERQITKAISDFLSQIRIYQRSQLVTTVCNTYQMHMWWKRNRGYSANVGLLMAKCNVTAITETKDHKTHNEHNNNDESLDSDEKDENNRKDKEDNKTNELNTTDSISTADLFNSTLNPLNSSNSLVNSGPYSFNTGPFVLDSISLPYAFPQYPSNNPFANSVWFGPNVRCTRPGEKCRKVSM